MPEDHPLVSRPWVSLSSSSLGAMDFRRKSLAPRLLLLSSSSSGD